MHGNPKRDPLILEVIVIPDYLYNYTKSLILFSFMKHYWDPLYQNDNSWFLNQSSEVMGSKRGGVNLKK